MRQPRCVHLGVTIENIDFQCRYIRIKIDLQTSGFAREGKHRQRDRVAGLEIDALSSRKLGGSLHSAFSRCKELWAILLFPGHFSVRCTDSAVDPRCHSGRSDRRNSLFYHSEMVETPGANCLVRRRDTMLLFAFGLLR